MNLKAIRIKNNLTQKEVAEKIQTNRVNYNRYELEKGEPDISTLIKLADLYHISIDELVGRKQQDIINKGLLSQTQIDIIEIMQHLNQNFLEKLESYATALYSTQKDQEIIKNKIKGA